MNADVVAAPSSTTTSLIENNLTGLNRHMAHMAESAIQSATSSSSKNSVDDCVSWNDQCQNVKWNVFNKKNLINLAGQSTVDVVMASDHVPDESNVPATTSTANNNNTKFKSNRHRPVDVDSQ